jgi:tRNA U34 5-carboxymethylaminomethyl modifying enzyme MnmG/GidA
LQFLVLVVCILLAIICGTFLYATFFSANSSNPEPNGQQNNGHLHKEIETLRNQIGQMAEETKMQKALEKLQNHTIVDLRAMVQRIFDIPT